MTAERPPGDEEAEIIDMNELIRTTAASTSAPYFLWDEPNDNPPPDAA